MLVGIDLGQGAVKVTALDAGGKVVGLRSEEYPTAHPVPGWSEQHPRDWVDATSRACRSLLAEVSRDGKGSSVDAVGLTSATHHAVLLDRDDRVLRPCILLTDSRSSEQASRLRAEYGPLILRSTRNQVSPTWTLPQFVWIAENEPEVWERVARVVLAKDYVRLLLTGESATDWIDAEGTLLFDSHTKKWDDDLCGLASIRADLLPPVFAPTEVTGQVTREGEKLTGIPSGTPVVAGCSDTAAEDFAAGAYADGHAVVKLATAGNVNLMTGDPQPEADLLTYTHPVRGLSYQCLATNSAASSKRWFQEVLSEGPAEVGYETLDAEAAQVPAGSEGVLFHPYLLGERSPYWDPGLRASFVGLSAAHGRGHMTRAVMEGVALSLADCMGVFEARGFPVREAYVIGGGARSVLWRRILCDVLGFPLHYPALNDASSGAALLAGVGAGVYPSPEAAVESTLEILAEEVPDEGRHRGYANLLGIYKDVQKRLAPVGPKLQRARFE